MWEGLWVVDCLRLGFGYCVGLGVSVCLFVVLGMVGDRVILGMK